MNYAILLSGGTGSRMGGDIPKQYIKVDGWMIITHALKNLLDSPHVDRLVIVAEKDWEEEILNDAKTAGTAPEKIIGFSAPGRNRQESILNGMEKIYEGTTADDDTVFVHDAARPMLFAELIDRCYDALPGHDGVLPVLPMKDTVYESRDGKVISKLLNRSEIYAGQAPELFNLKKYFDAVMKLVPDGIMQINGSSEPAIMAGMDIAIIPGDEGNFKITTPADLQRFTRIMEGNI